MNELWVRFRGGKIIDGYICRGKKFYQWAGWRVARQSNCTSDEAIWHMVFEWPFSSRIGHRQTRAQGRELEELVGQTKGLTLSQVSDLLRARQMLGVEPRAPFTQCDRFNAWSIQHKVEDSD